MPLSTRSRARLEQIVGLWDQLVDPKVGIIQRIEELPVDDDDPDFFHYFSKACDASRFTAMRNFGDNGGASTDRYSAIAKAMGEAIERYCSAIYDPAGFRFAAHRELNLRAVHPELLTMYLPEQYLSEGFLWHPFTVDTPVHWTPARSLVTGERVFVPAAAVYIPFHYHGATRSAFILQPISTGLACGGSIAEATISGLCEVLERDAFTITWQAMMSCPVIRHETLPAFGCDLVSRFEAVGIRVYLMDITTDIGVPAIMTVGVSNAETSPAVAVAAAADPSPERCLLKSLDELAHTRMYARQLLRYTPPLPVEVDRGHPLVKDQRDHLRFYCPQYAKPFAEFAWSSTRQIDLCDEPDLSAGSPSEQLRKLVENTVAAGLEPLVVELTTPDVAELGLHVVRVVVPGAHPLYMGHRNRALGVTRLYEVPRKLGHRGLARNEPDNPYPHPFP
ncbi:MAG: YcaO-like family protein [Acidobacteriaceae bacterium]|nr:YcaO-like family protein [Acidobacteriaceae bacterium]